MAEMEWEIMLLAGSVRKVPKSSKPGSCIGASVKRLKVKRAQCV